jgi:hypothetical protein
MERTLLIPRRVHSCLSVLPRVARLPIVLVSLLFVTVLQAGAQDKEALIREALSAAPPEVAKTAIVRNWDGTVLKPGTGAYTCYPTRDSMKKRGKMSMCLDKTWQAWADAWQNKKPFKANEVGIAYMLAGDVGSSNTDPYAEAPTSNNQWVEPGPHIMIIVPNPAELEGISTDPYSGGPFVMWKAHPMFTSWCPSASVQRPNAELLRGVSTTLQRVRRSRQAFWTVDGLLGSNPRD